MQFVFFFSLSRSFGITSCALLYWATNSYWLMDLWLLFGGFFYTIRTLCDIWNEAMLLQIIFILRFGLFRFSNGFLFDAHRSTCERNKKKLRRKMTEKQSCVLFCVVKEMRQRWTWPSCVCLLFYDLMHSFEVYGNLNEFYKNGRNKTIDAVCIFIALNFVTI